MGGWEDGRITKESRTVLRKTRKKRKNNADE